MYEPLENCATDFNNLQKTLADPAGGPRLMAIRDALEATARNVSETTGDTEVDRNNLAKLYRGLLAASRIVAQLAEKRGAA